MQVINTVGADSVQDHQGNVHKAGPDGVFTTLPLEFARELVTRHAAHWREASAHEAALHQAQVEQLRNPHILPGVVAELRDRLERAEARLDALESAAKPSPRTAKKTAAKPEQ